MRRLIHGRLGFFEIPGVLLMRMTEDQETSGFALHFLKIRMG
jgi:hypothetical protein